jgi:hypothetical protein
MKLGCMLAGMLILMSLGIADGRMPVVGDYVKIITPAGIHHMIYVGNITDMDDSLICLNCTQALIEEVDGSDVVQYPNGFGQICVGKAGILRLEIFDELTQNKFFTK